jgi:hypothetical protein
VVPADPDVPASADHAFEGLGAANREALDATHQRLRIVAVDHEVQVVGLHREVHDPERDLMRRRERVADAGVDSQRAK